MIDAATYVLLLSIRTNMYVYIYIYLFDHREIGSHSVAIQAQHNLSLKILLLGFPSGMQPC